MALKNGEKGKKSFIQKLFSTMERNGKKMPEGSFDSSGAKPNLETENPFCGGERPLMSTGQGVMPFRVFVATWNVGGKSPHSGLNLDDFLHVHDQADIYVLGFEEIVPLNAGNVLVIEDNEPAAKWLQLINQSLNKSPAVYVLNNPTYPPDNRYVGRRGLKVSATTGGSLFFPKYSLKTFSQAFRTESGKRLKACNCTTESETKYGKDCCFQCPKSSIRDNESSSEEDDELDSFSAASRAKHMKYSLVACKQMVGIFVTIWMKKELVQHVGHLKIFCVSRGIMGCLGNKGCISVRMTFHQTSFCFICSHLASGEKEGDELRRNVDVIEIIKSTQFAKICKTPASRVPEKILDHERVIWFGDLNYRIALSYSETRKLLEENAWDALLDKDQLKIEREEGRVFKGWQEGKIYFAPTYKYSYNSDTYFGDTTKSKAKRRTPAWCDRILWHGDGIRQLSYVRGESQFSDHRPVCATFLVDVHVANRGDEMLLSPTSKYLQQQIQV